MLINYNNFGLSTRQIQNKETEEYRRYLINSGMEELTKDDFLQVLSNLNYKLDKSSCFNYYNNYNKINYKAYACTYIDIKSGQSYAHYEQRLSNHINLDKLQKVRDMYFVYEKGRIWDL